MVFSLTQHLAYSLRGQSPRRLWAIQDFQPDRQKKEAVGCPVLDFLGVRHTPVPWIFAPGGLDLSSGIDRHSTARTIFPQVLLLREVSLRRKSLQNRTGHNCRRAFSGIAGLRP